MDSLLGVLRIGRRNESQSIQLFQRRAFSTNMRIDGGTELVRRSTVFMQMNCSLGIVRSIRINMRRRFRGAEPELWGVGADGD